MKVFFAIRRRLATVGLGIAVLGAAGCERDRSTVTIQPDGAAKVEPRYSPPKQSVDDLKNDIKPPVVVKPGAPASSANPSSPNGESR